MRKATKGAHLDPDLWGCPEQTEGDHGENLPMKRRGLMWEADCGGFYIGGAGGRTLYLAWVYLQSKNSSSRGHLGSPGGLLKELTLGLVYTCIGSRPGRRLGLTDPGCGVRIFKHRLTLGEGAVGMET